MLFQSLACLLRVLTTLHLDHLCPSLGIYLSSLDTSNLFPVVLSVVHAIFKTRAYLKPINRPAPQSRNFTHQAWLASRSHPYLYNPTFPAWKILNKWNDHFTLTYGVSSQFVVCHEDFRLSSLPDCMYHLLEPTLTTNIQQPFLPTLASIDDFHRFINHAIFASSTTRNLHVTNHHQTNRWSRCQKDCSSSLEYLFLSSLWHD